MSNKQGNKSIKQSVLNTFKRVGIDHEAVLSMSEDTKVHVYNRFTGEQATTSPLVAICIHKVYEISNQYEYGNMSVNISDFDRLRYFVLEQDQEAYNTCLD